MLPVPKQPVGAGKNHYRSNCHQKPTHTGKAAENRTIIFQIGEIQDFQISDMEKRLCSHRLQFCDSPPFDQLICADQQYNSNYCSNQQDGFPFLFALCNDRSTTCTQCGVCRIFPTFPDTSSSARTFRRKHGLRYRQYCHRLPLLPEPQKRSEFLPGYLLLRRELHTAFHRRLRW